MRIYAIKFKFLKKSLSLNPVSDESEYLQNPETIIKVKILLSVCLNNLLKVSLRLKNIKNVYFTKSVHFV